MHKVLVRSEREADDTYELTEPNTLTSAASTTPRQYPCINHLRLAQSKAAIEIICLESTSTR